MTIFTEEDERITAGRLRGRVAKESQTDFGRNLETVRESFSATDRLGAEKRRLSEEIDSARSFVKSRIGVDLDQPLRADSYAPEFLQPASDRDMNVNSLIKDPISLFYDTFHRKNDLTESQRLKQFEADLTRIRDDLPEDEKDLLPSVEEMRAKIRSEAKAKIREADDVSRRATTTGSIGGFVGGAVAALSEPSVIATMFIGAPVRAALLPKMLMESVIGASTEALIQPEVQRQRASLGVPHGVDVALQNILTAGVGAAGLTLGIGSIAKAMRSIGKGGVKAFEKIKGRKATAEEEAIVIAHQRDIVVEAATPYKEETARSAQVNRLNGQAATDAMTEGRILRENEIIHDESLTLKTQDEIDKAIHAERPEALEQITRRLKEDGLKIFASEKDSEIIISKIIVPEKERNQGIGTKAMRDLIDYADTEGKRISLTPSKDFGGTKSRLVKFYKGLGFVENKGKNKDFEVSETMYRKPKVEKNPKPEIAQAAPKGLTEREKIAFELDEVGIVNPTNREIDEIVKLRSTENVSVSDAFERVAIRQVQSPELLQVDDEILKGFATPNGQASIEQIDGIINEFADLHADNDLNLLDIPVGERVGSDGEIVVETRTLRQMLDEIKQDESFIEELNLCEGMRNVA